MTEYSLSDLATATRGNDNYGFGGEPTEKMAAYYHGIVD